MAWPSFDQSDPCISTRRAEASTRAPLPSALSTATVARFSPTAQRKKATLAPSGDQNGFASRASVLASRSRSRPSPIVRSHNSLRPARTARYATFEPSDRTSKSTSPRFPGVIGSGWPVTRPVAGSNGNAHNRVVFDRVVKSNRVPSEERATLDSSPAPVVRRSGASSQCPDAGSTATRQTFWVSPVRPSK